MAKEKAQLTSELQAAQKRADEIAKTKDSISKERDALQKEKEELKRKVEELEKRPPVQVFVPAGIINDVYFIETK